MSKARLAYVNLFARDHVALARFYRTVFGFEEIRALRSPIYRCLDAGGVEMGFNAENAYALLGLDDRVPTDRASVRTYVTIEVDSTAAIDAALAVAVKNGALLVKAAYDTYYNARQAVMEDPEGNVFRINHRMGPRIPAEELVNPPWEAEGST